MVRTKKSKVLFQGYILGDYASKKMIKGNLKNSKDNKDTSLA